MEWSQSQNQKPNSTIRPRGSKFIDAAHWAVITPISSTSANFHTNLLHQSNGFNLFQPSFRWRHLQGLQRSTHRPCASPHLWWSLIFDLSLLLFTLIFWWVFFLMCFMNWVLILISHSCLLLQMSMSSTRFAILVSVCFFWFCFVFCSID